MTKAEREKLIAKQMAILNVSRAEAEEIVAEDERIDGLTMGELKKECGEEAWAVMKEMTATGERKIPKTAENSPKTGKKPPQTSNSTQDRRKRTMKRKISSQNWLKCYKIWSKMSKLPIQTEKFVSKLAKTSIL